MEQNKLQQLNQVTEIKLSYNPPLKTSLHPKIVSAKTAYELLLQYWDKDVIQLYEEFKIILLNRSNLVIGIYPLSKGGLSSTVADPRLIFVAALKAAATFIILAHNHPSGSITPGEADKKLTDKISLAGRLLDVIVIDHIILTAEGYYSFAEEGLL